ncbi:hypothetical protein CBF23_003430 [Marinomonas agarivorans]|nr:hypothetical protein CBF23_003430 [Marinomonas agarivorans]
MSKSPFRLPKYTPFHLGESLIEWATGLGKLDGFYQQRPRGLSSLDFMKYTLNCLNIDYQVTQGSIENIPATGATVIVANHPLGAIEGVILAALIGEYRPDTKVLANQMLKSITEIAPLFIGVDVFGGKTAKETNRRAIMEANQHLADGGLLIIFPAGEVSSYQKDTGLLADVEWRNSVAKFIHHANAECVPIYIDGKNSKLFYQAGRIHPLLRTVLLGHQLLNKQGSMIKLSIGESIPYSTLSQFDDEAAMVTHLRQATYTMQHH